MPTRRDDIRTGPRPSRGALAAAASLIVALGVGPGCRHGESEKPKAEEKPRAETGQAEAPTARIERRDIRKLVVQPGTIQAYESTPVFSRIAGYVDKYHVNIGDRVKTGQTILTMWIPDLLETLNQKKSTSDRARVQIRVAESSAKAARSTLENARAHVVSAEAGVKRAQAGYSRWESEYNRLNKLVADQVLNTQVRDETHRQFEEAAAARDQANAMVHEAVASRDKSEADLQRSLVDVEAAKADLDVALADQKLAQVTLDYGDIKAPYDGVITQRNVSPGDYLQAGGGTGGRPLFMLEQTDPVRVFVGVPELAAAFITDDATALIRLQAVAGDTRRGKIVRSGFSLNPSSRTLQTEIDIENANGHLRPGMYVTVTIAIDRRQVFAVPSRAVIALGGDSYAIELQSGDKAVRMPVLIGPSDDRYTEILRKRGEGPQAEDWIPPDGNEVFVKSPGTGERVATPAVK